MDSIHNSYKKIMDNLHDGLYFVDKFRKITYWNKSAEKITGFKAQEVIGTSCSSNILTHVDCEGNSLCKGMCPLAATMDDNIERESDVFLHHKDGHRVPVSVRVSTLQDNKGEVIGGIELFSDISSKQANEERIKELEKLALIDKLTELANRNFVEREIMERLEEMRRYKIPFGLIFLDIDNFKHFNDKFGHDIGDKVLKYVSNTLVKNGRPFDLYGRWGGEEFVGIIRNIQEKDLRNLCTRINMLVENSYLTNCNKKLSVTVSIGATLAKDSDTINILIKRADMLMYKSKENGKNQYTFG